MSTQIHGRGRRTRDVIGGYFCSALQQQQSFLKMPLEEEVKSVMEQRLTKMLKCEPVSARSRPDDVEEGLGRRDDVERHRHGQAFSEVAEVELGASKLPLHVGVVL